MVSTPLKNISKIGSSSQLTVGENKNCSKPPTSYMYMYMYIYNININLYIYTYIYIYIRIYTVYHPQFQRVGIQPDGARYYCLLSHPFKVMKIFVGIMLPHPARNRCVKTWGKPVNHGKPQIHWLVIISHYLYYIYIYRSHSKGHIWGYPIFANRSGRNALEVAGIVMHAAAVW